MSCGINYLIHYYIGLG